MCMCVRCMGGVVGCGGACRCSVPAMVVCGHSTVADRRSGV